jgi:hypothetical protein
MLYGWNLAQSIYIACILNEIPTGRLFYRFFFNLGQSRQTYAQIWASTFIHFSFNIYFETSFIV